MSGHVSRSGAAGVLLAVVVAGGFVHRTAYEPPRYRDDGVDLTASALTAPDSSTAVDDAYLVSWSGDRRERVDTTASANASCDDCSADSTALQIVYLNRPTEVVLNNVGVAWSQCAGCRTTAVSVQVVVLRSAQQIHANNRALALNATCEGCVTAAAAYQLVVVGGRERRLSTGQRQELRRWVAEQAAALRGEGAGTAPTAFRTGSSVSPPASTATDALDALAAMVSADLGGAETLQRDADVRTSAPEPDPPPPPTADASPGPAPPEPDTTPSPSPTPTPDPTEASARTEPA